MRLAFGGIERGKGGEEWEGKEGKGGREGGKGFYSPLVKRFIGDARPPKSIS